MEKAKSGKEVTIFIGGDFCPIGRNATLINKGIFDEILGDMYSSMQDVDLCILNLESPLTQSNDAISKSGPNIKANPNAINLLNHAGVNLLTLANNHIMDFGIKGLSDTMEICKAHNIDTVGAGLNKSQNSQPYSKEIYGKKLVILNFAENEFNKIGEAGANTINLIDNYKQIQHAKKSADFLMVIVHGGREHYQLPTPDVRERYRFFADSGADLIVAHHPHCYSGYEIYKDTPIFYSLGNFLFDYKRKYQKGNWTECFALKLRIQDNKKIDFELIPFFQGREFGSGIELMKGDEELKFRKRIRELNKIIVNDKEFYKKWEQYIETQKKAYISILNVPNKYLRYLQSKGILPSMGLNKPYKNILLNLNRCETHQEILKAVLEK